MERLSLRGDSSPLGWGWCQRTLHRRQTEAPGHQQTGKLLPAKALRAQGACRVAVEREAVVRSPGMLEQLTSRTHPNILAVALANKLARMTWAVLAKQQEYRPPLLSSTANN